MEKKKRIRKREEKENQYIVLTLKCPQCDWKWTEAIDCSTPYSSAQCPNCFHKPIYLISLM